MREISRLIKQRVYEMKGFAHDFKLEEYARHSNQEFSLMQAKEQYISELDNLWSGGKEEDRITKILENPLSQILRRRIEFYQKVYGYPVISEMYVTNQYGAIVGSSGRSSDYLQADEAWYQQAIQSREFWLGPVEYDMSSKVVSMDIVLPLYGAGKELCGVFKAVLNLKDIQESIQELQARSPYTNRKLYLIDSKGNIIFSKIPKTANTKAQDLSLEDFAQNLRFHPGAQQIFANKKGFFSTYIHEKYLFVAFSPFASCESIKSLDGGIILEIEYEEIFSVLLQNRNVLIVVSCLLFFLSIIAAFWISRSIALPLRKLEKTALKISQGDPKIDIPIFSQDESGTLSLAFLKMLQEIKEKEYLLAQRNQELEILAYDISCERNEYRAVLASMAEGVLAVDNEGKILNLNKAAAKMFGVSIDARGKNIYTEFPVFQLSQLLKNVLVEQKRVETNLRWNEGQEKVLHIYGTVLKNSQEHCIGAILVMQDITRIEKLECMRRDFVANVSHELKTPVTSIKGFAETLLDGASKNSEKSEAFMQIILRQADRLKQIIDDLLTLSHLEQYNQENPITMMAVSLQEVIQNALEICFFKAKENQIALEFQMKESVVLMMNPHLIEQAISNLIDNAIKYSKPQGKVKISVENEDRKVAIHIQDEGCGIEAEHLERIFERFYRVDKARDRKLGGTGLGLAIVKHIAIIHQGKVEVKSTPEKGSKFSILLPQIPRTEQESETE